VAAIEQAVQATITYGSQLTDLAARTGIAVESLQKFDLAAKQNGTSIDTLVMFWQKLARARDEALGGGEKGDKKLAAFKQFGVSKEDLKTGSQESITRQMATALQKSSNMDEMISPFMEIGGKGAGALVAFFKDGLDEKVQDMVVMSGEQAQALDELDDSMVRLKQTILAGLAPAVVWAVSLFEKITDGIEWMASGMTMAVSKLMTAFADIKVTDIANPLKLGEKIGKAVMGAGAGFKEAFTDAYKSTNKKRAAEDEARKKAVNERLNKPDMGEYEVDNGKAAKAVKEQLKSVAEIKLDDLSKAGLFAGGAGSGANVSNIPQRQLSEMEKITRGVIALQRTVEDAL
jgi:hypothetical protein